MNQHTDIKTVSCPICGNEIHTIVAVPPWASGMVFVTEVCERCQETLNVEVEVEK